MTLESPRKPQSSPALRHLTRAAVLGLGLMTPAVTNASAADPSPMGQPVESIEAVEIPQSIHALQITLHQDEDVFSVVAAAAYEPKHLPKSPTVPTHDAILNVGEKSFLMSLENTRTKIRGCFGGSPSVEVTPRGIITVVFALPEGTQMVPGALSLPGEPFVPFSVTVQESARGE